MHANVKRAVVSYLEYTHTHTHIHTHTHTHTRTHTHTQHTHTLTIRSAHFVDLYGLLFFLRVEPYVAEIWWKSLLWKPFAEGNWTPMLRTCSKLLWRNSKLDVAEEVRGSMLIGWIFRAYLII